VLRLKVCQLQAAAAAMPGESLSAQSDPEASLCSVVSSSPGARGHESPPLSCSVHDSTARIIKTSGYAMVVHGRPKTPKNTSFLGVTQPPGVAQPLYSRGHN